MKKISVLIAALLLSTVTACGNNDKYREESGRKIRVSNGENEVIYALNSSKAAKELYDKLPINTEAEQYGTNEIIFYPNFSLNIKKTPKAKADVGTLAYYKPWNDIVFFYDYNGESDELYELGHSLSGEENIESLAGDIKIEAVE